MIHYIQSNMFDAPAQIFAHQVNCMGVMGSGVAAQVKRRFPVAFELYKELCDKYEIRKEYLLGTTQICPVTPMDGFAPKLYVANLFAQYDFGRSKYRLYTNYMELRECLHKLAEFETSGSYTIAIPFHIGCDRGGGDWDGHVKPMIESILRECEVFVCQYPPKIG